MKRLEEMSIGDVIETPMFKKNMAEAIERINMMPKAYRRNHRVWRPVDRLKERGVFDERHMTELFVTTMKKELVDYSSGERTMILMIGREVLLQTIKQISDDEAARDHGDGDDQQ